MRLDRTNERLNKLHSDLEAARQQAAVAQKELKAAERKAERAEAVCASLIEAIAVEQLRLWGDKPDLAALLDADGSMAFYQFLDRLTEIYGLGMSGGWLDTKQVVLHVRMNRGEIGTVDRAAKAIRYFAPAVKSIRGGWARFNVHHPNMDQCAWHLHYSVKRQNAQLVKQVFGRSVETLQFPSLEFALRHVEEHLFFEDIIDQAPLALAEA